jgi:hypothetical protein
MYVNKKLLNSAQFSIGKINYDTDEIIYLTEIISNYFNDYKETQNNDKSDNTEETENTEDSKDNNDDEIKDNYKKPLINNSKLITFMNNYNMNINCLENILKIEKLNQINEKKKKKFTLKIKKDISKFLITKD